MNSIPKKRIEYIDAMRGLTMLLVVVAHVSGHGLGVGDNFTYNLIIVRFRMPLFFFVSGFVLYKASFDWNIQNTLTFLKKKIPVQILSPLLFFTISVTLRDKSFFGALGSESKAGYWFTFMLFSYFLVYIFAHWIMRLSEKLRKYEDIVLLALGLGVYVFVKYYNLEPGIVSKIARALMFVKWQYFIYFIIGTRVRKHFGEYENCLDSKYFTLICVSLFVIVNVFNGRGVQLDKGVSDFILAITGINIVFALFRKNRDIFSSQTRIGKVAQFVGRRTLDIYLLHFLFVYAGMPHFFTYFSTHCSPFLEFVTSIGISVLIIMACLVLSSIIRLSPILAHYLFGQKINNA